MGFETITINFKRERIEEKQVLLEWSAQLFVTDSTRARKQNGAAAARWTRRCRQTDFVRSTSL